MKSTSQPFCMLFMSRTLAFSCFPPLLCTAQFSNYDLSQHRWVTFGSTLCSSRCWLATLQLRSCTLEGRKFSVLVTFQIIQNKQDNSLERPFVTHSSSLHSCLGLCLLTQHWPLLSANGIRQSPYFSSAAAPTEAHTRALHRDDGHRHPEQG